MNNVAQLEKSDFEHEVDISSFEPFGQMMLVRMDKPKEQTQGGIFLPNKVQGDQQAASVTGTVLRMGPLAFKARDGSVMADVKVGDRVVFQRYAGQVIHEKGSVAPTDQAVAYRIVASTDVLGRVAND